MAVNSRQELVEFCFRQLGSPIVEINIDESQIDDSVDMALSYYFDFHIDGLERNFFTHTITQEDLTNRFITLPDSIISVVRLLPLDSAYTVNIQYQAFITDILDQIKNGKISNYITTMQYFNTVNDLFNHEKTIQFNRHTNKLKIETNWSKIFEGAVLMIECYTMINPDDYPSLYNDKWLKRYLTQLFKIQWATNLKKYDGITLPGGLVVDSKTWYDEATAEKALLETELKETYQMPTSFFIG